MNARTILEPQPKGSLPATANASRTSDYAISDDARVVYAAHAVRVLESADDLMIALEIKTRLAKEQGDLVEIVDLMREQGYNPADFTP